MIFLFVGKLSRLYSNSKHLIIRKKKFAGKLTIGANPRKFSTANDLHYTVVCCVEGPSYVATDLTRSVSVYLIIIIIINVQTSLLEVYTHIHKIITYNYNID